MIASLDYLIDGFGRFLSTSYKANIASLTFAGEALLIGWLCKGRRL